MAKHLLPLLRGALRGQRAERFDVSTGLLPGDEFLTTAPIGGIPASTRLIPLGYCLSREAPGEPPYALRVYVAPDPTACVTYATRSAARFEVGQHEEHWFGGIHLTFTELDLTDYADEVRLVRPPAPAAEPTPTEPEAGAVVRPLYPTPAPTVRRQAA